MDYTFKRFQTGEVTHLSTGLPGQPTVARQPYR
jgi:hypothetical protein